jgi:hypothetical protein
MIHDTGNCKTNQLHSVSGIISGSQVRALRGPPLLRDVLVHSEEYYDKRGERMRRMRLRSFKSAAATWLAGLCMLCTPVATQGQACREPSPQERQAVENAVRVMKQAVEGPVTSLGWKAQANELATGGISVASNPNPMRPLMSCTPLYAAKYQITEANPRYAAIHSEIEKLNNGNVQPDGIKGAAQAMAASVVEIRATENIPNMRTTRSHPIRRLEIQGVAVAFQEPTNDELMEDTVLCFGAWKPDVVFGTDNRFIPFPFQHPKGTPFIENLCVRIHAAPEMTDAILRKVNWQQLNASLTK